MAKPNPKQAAVGDLANSENYLFIGIEGTKVHRHMALNSPVNALAILRAIKEAEMQILNPPPASSIIKP